jgi:peptidyl-prolyl cis-trans isomerase C
MKIKQLLITIAVFSAFAFTPAVYAADAAGTVNGKPIKQSWVDYIMKDAKDHGQTPSDNMKTAIIKELVGSELVFQEAQKQGLDKSSDFLVAQELANRKMLMTAFIQDFVKKNPVSEAEVKAEYDQYKKETGDKEYNARHILVKTETEAKDVIARIKKGDDFAKVAKEKSLDTGNKDKGGDLNWFSAPMMVKPFSDAVADLKKGELTSAPVQTQFGWHVIKLIDTRPATLIPFEKAKPEIESKLQQIKIQKMVIGLKDKAKIDIPGVTDKGDKK